MASRDGFIKAHYRIGYLLELDNPSKEKQKKAVSFYRVAAEKGHVQSLFRLALLYHNGTTRNYTSAFRLYTLAAQQEDQSAQLAICVLSGSAWKEKQNRLSKHPMTSKLRYASYLRMWKIVADQGNVELQFNLGMMHEEVGTYSSLPEAARWYSRAAECSHDLALYRLGRLYEAGRGVKQDYLQAIKCYEIAKDPGNIDAPYQLGIIYQHGKGVKADTNKAVDYFTQAAQKGSSMAQFTLGQLYEKGELVSKNILEAVKWYSTSNSQANGDAHKWLYTYYDKEYSNDTFYDAQFHLLSQITNINSNRTQHQNNTLIGEVNYKLGLMYFYGYGTKLDYKKAQKSFRESTKLCDNNAAQFFSEITYNNMPSSYTEEYWKKVDMFEAAVEQLDIEDIYELGLIYYHGLKRITKNSKSDESHIIISLYHDKLSRYFRMIVNEDLSGKIVR
jgi:TPR repeat protein